MEDSDMEDKASIGNEREACYINKDEALEDMGPLLNDIGTLPEAVFEHSNQLVELSGDKKEDKISSSSRKPKMVVWNYGNVSDFMSLIRKYALRIKKPLHFAKNDRSRVHVKCLQEGCGFSVFCSKIGKTNDLGIKTLVGEHTCGTSITIPTITVKWLAKRLWSYAKEILDIMSSSTVITKLHEQKFERVYKGAFKSQILAVVGLDGDNDISPIAWAVVEMENTQSWAWFIKLVNEDLGMDRGPNSWILMTDLQKVPLNYTP
ncbi:hypothetical protein LIER_13966 [Lithospermum erythrorhizon]|uniref:Transposase MuDR plant domain-containing protein n=1 Tax=Lithospermum erythrorhizon TaxID=34254 RepID=A0AAV3Q1H8_LITER